MALFDLVSFSPKGKIGDLEIPVTLEEVHVDSTRMTEHPVELGASITDHAFMRPRELVIKCGWSNSTYSAFVSMIKSLFGNEVSPSASDYVGQVYDRLRAMQENAQLIEVVTSKRRYSNMLIVGLQVTTDASTSAALIVQATLRQAIIVETSATTLPTKKNQANPASTASVENVGVKQLVARTPMPGGSVANEDM